MLGSPGLWRARELSYLKEDNRLGQTAGGYNAMDSEHVAVISDHPVGLSEEASVLYQTWLYNKLQFRKIS